MSRLESNRGFTIIEMVVIMPIIMLSLAILVSALFGQYAQLVESSAKLNLKVEGQAILIGLQDDIEFADSFGSAIRSDLSDTYASDYTSALSANRMIINSPALTASHRDSNRTTVYKNQVGCAAADLTDNDIVYDNIIYFIKSGTLYKRFLTYPTPNGNETCGTNFVKKSCPSSVTLSTACPSYDRVLSTHIDTLVLTYYTANNTVTTDPTLAQRVLVSIGLKDKINAEYFTESTSMTMRKVN